MAVVELRQKPETRGDRRLSLTPLPPSPGSTGEGGIDAGWHLSGRASAAAFLTRRRVLSGMGVAAASAFLPPSIARTRALPAGQAAEELTIDLAVEPATLDPALV